MERSARNGVAAGGQIPWAISMSIDFARTEKPLGIARSNAPRLIPRQLREPAAILAHDVVVAEPPLVDPRIGTEQEAVAVFCEQLAPLGAQLAAAFRDAAAVGQLAPQRRIAFQQLLHTRR